jgi:hypothetical protein
MQPKGASTRQWYVTCTAYMPSYAAATLVLSSHTRPGGPWRQRLLALPVAAQLLILSRAFPPLLTRSPSGHAPCHTLQRSGIPWSAMQQPTQCLECFEDSSRVTSQAQVVRMPLFRCLSLSSPLPPLSQRSRGQRMPRCIRHTGVACCNCSGEEAEQPPFLNAHTCHARMHLCC